MSAFCSPNKWDLLASDEDEVSGEEGSYEASTNPNQESGNKSIAANLEANNNPNQETGCESITGSHKANVNPNQESAFETVAGSNQASTNPNQESGWESITVFCSPNMWDLLPSNEDEVSGEEGSYEASTNPNQKSGNKTFAGSNQASANPNQESGYKSIPANHDPNTNPNRKSGYKTFNGSNRAKANPNQESGYKSIAANNEPNTNPKSRHLIGPPESNGSEVRLFNGDYRKHLFSGDNAHACAVAKDYLARFGVWNHTLFHWIGGDRQLTAKLHRGIQVLVARSPSSLIDNPPQFQLAKFLLAAWGLLTHC